MILRSCFAFLLVCTASPAADSLLFSYFRGNGEDGLHLASSTDGLHWKALNTGRSFLQPVVGESKLMRDPSIARGPDGLFHMVWTTSWQGRSLGYASSPDLLAWSAQQVIPNPLEGEIVNSWAPELFYDSPSRQFLIVWASTVKGRFLETAGQGNRDYNHRLYAIRTADFKSFSKPELFLDPGFQVIDAAIFRDGKRYVVVAKNETLTPPAKYLFLTFADSLRGPWSKPSPPISGNEWAEGPTPVRVGKWWHIYFDKYRDHRYGLIRSRDLEHWEDLSAQLAFPEGARHGTVFAAPAPVVKKLLLERR
jgi:hypothetical protein